MNIFTNIKKTTDSSDVMFVYNIAKSQAAFKSGTFIIMDIAERRNDMIYSKEVENMCTVKCGASHGCAPIPEEGKWVYSRKSKISLV